MNKVANRQVICDTLIELAKNDKDIMYQKGTKIAENVYDINGFHIRFFTKQDINFFVNGNFEIQKIIEDYEEPASLYLAFCYK